MCSSTVKSSNRTLCCGHKPRLFRTPSMLVLMSSPYTTAVPEVGGNSPVSIDMVVDFPAPLWPNSDVTCPSKSFRFNPSTAFFLLRE